ncbi:hypothetical protein N7468_009884 [Penicillium chermesinum]|uniref:Uncharacterized protein n=1 Tax=Penicillium chermesinum TaxID=63820 RepID=A0A9W9TBX3_9EURO|nr:uncharacterized protein N7468_009884 [Penicillium chermesinum]KAJ5216876.1 hypothetical protein N7468_009884 [Penicillium chermesinum]KAJ6171508.1 hypothetical protein N7470_000575 [Penicillium chermesinum]
MYALDSEVSVPCDDTSSIYSRSSTSPKFWRPASTPLPSKHSLPEINALDHQIALLQGSTIALETTQARLQAGKTERRKSEQEAVSDKLQQYYKQEAENRFYRTCRSILHQLLQTSSDVYDMLELQCEFEPEVSLFGNARLRMAAETLQMALDASRTQEVQAEQEWKREWNPSPAHEVQTGWI